MANPLVHWGDAAFFSTDHSKPLNTIIGGMLYTPDKDIFEDVKRTIGNLPDLSKNHQKNIFQRFNYERKNYIPSRYPRSIIRETIRDTMGRFFGKPQVFLESDYTPSISVSSSYPYPAKMPAFLAQLGLFEIERWANEKRERKALLQDYLNYSEIARYEIQIPNAYYDKGERNCSSSFYFQISSSNCIKKKI